MSQWLLFNPKWTIFQLYHGKNKLHEMMLMMVSFVLDQHTWLDFYCASSPKQQSVGRHVPPLWHIILILSQPVFALASYCCVLGEETTNTKFIVFGLTHMGLEHTIYHTRGEHTNHFTTDSVLFIKIATRLCP